MITQTNTVARTKLNAQYQKSSHAYKNETWDLVDAADKDKDAVAKAEEKELPKEMKGMSLEQRKQYVDQKAADRKAIQGEIKLLNDKRQAIHRHKHACCYASKYARCCYDTSY